MARYRSIVLKPRMPQVSKALLQAIQIQSNSNSSIRRFWRLKVIPLPSNSLVRHIQASQKQVVLLRSAKST